MTDRRVFLSILANAAWAGSLRELGYVDWSWERWRKITGEARPRISSEQAGQGELSDLLMFRSRKITTAAEWDARRVQILEVIRAILGPAPETKPQLEIKLREEVKLDSHIRRQVVFQTEPGEFVPGYLLVPHRLQKPSPAVICPHQTTQAASKEPAGIEGNPQLHMALRLAERGYVTFTYDAACFGERHNPASGHYGDAIPFYERHPRWSMMGKMVWDFSRAVDFLQTLDFVDRTRIGSIGHSHGGYTTLFAMALDERVAAGVSSCGFDTFRYDGNVFRWSHATALLPRLGFFVSSPHINMDRYRAMPDSETVQAPFDMHELLALAAPRPLMLSTSDEDFVFPNSGWSARQALARLEPLYKLLGAGERLGSYFFSGGHSFPQTAADRAYAWLDRWLRA